MRARRAPALTILLVAVCSVGSVITSCSAFTSSPAATTTDGDGGSENESGVGVDGSSSFDATGGVDGLPPPDSGGDSGLVNSSCGVPHDVCDDFEQEILTWPRWTDNYEKDGGTIKRSLVTPNPTTAGKRSLGVDLPTSPSEGYVQRKFNITNVKGVHCQFRMRIDQADSDRMDILSIELDTYQFVFAIQDDPMVVVFSEGNSIAVTSASPNISTWTFVEIDIALNNSVDIKVDGTYALHSAAPSPGPGTMTGSGTISSGGLRSVVATSPAHLLLDDIVCDVSH